MLLFAATVASAQLAPPNAAGVTNGHLHLRVRDTEAQRKFFVDGLGAGAIKVGNFDVVKMPGTLILIQKGEPSGGTDGSVIGHLAFLVRDMKGTLARLAALGVKMPEKVGRQAMVMGPEEVKVELTEDPALTTPVAHHHIHWYNRDVKATQAWYAKHFGAVPGKRGNFEAADIPGANLTFALAETATAPTKGRALDHIGFEVKNLEAFCQKLEAAGVKLDVAYRQVPKLKLGLAFLTDPWGAYIELTEGLDQW
ncbi:MAG: VOC family protein [Acidobacteria bacterium]|nr:VOC family protein [Acidobacteriota bacterium]